MPDSSHILGAMPINFENGCQVRINAASMNRFFTKSQLEKFPEMEYFNEEDGRHWEPLLGELPNRWSQGFHPRKSRADQVMKELI